MSKLTETQFYYLKWLHDQGGRAIPWRNKVKSVDGNAETGMGAPISFLNLVAKGAVMGRAGFIEITDYGRRLLKP